MSVRIYCNGDDQIYIEAHGIETQHDGDDRRIFVGDAKGGLMIHIVYGDNEIGVWSFGLAQVDEGIPVPWPVRVENPRPGDQIGDQHSLALVVDCPPGTPVQVMPDDE